MNKAQVYLFLGFFSVWPLQSKAIHRPDLEIGKMTIEDVTDRYPRSDQWFQQDALSSCVETTGENQNLDSSLLNQGQGSNGGGMFGSGGGMYGGGYQDYGGVLDPSYPNQLPDGSFDPLAQLSYKADIIMNLGRKIWSLVRMGKPEVNVRRDVAHALPQGIKCWTELENWSWPQTKVFKVQTKNKLGGTVLDYTYRITYNYGGQYKKVGRYLTNIKVTPVHLNVGWGFTFSSNAEVPTVFNIGTSEAPVAGAQVIVNWELSSPVTTRQESQQFQISGANFFKKVQDRL